MVLEYKPSNIGLDRVATFINDGDILEGPTGSRSLILLNGLSNTVTATLPPVVYCKKQTFTIKCIDATYQCGFIATVPDTVDGSAALIVLGLYESKTIRSDGLNWWVI